MLQFDVITLFPQMFGAVTASGVTGRAREKGFYQLVAWNPRDFAHNAYRTVDDRPYGGGPGMVMMPEPLGKAVAAARQRQKSAGVNEPRVIHLTPQGLLLNHSLVMELAAEQGVVLLAGRYEGVDERVIAREVDTEISIGDYVLSGGELAAMVVIDSIVRQLPGVLGDADSASQDSFVNGLLDCPHYTRPEQYEVSRCPRCCCRATMRRSAAGGWQRWVDLAAAAVCCGSARCRMTSAGCSRFKQTKWSVNMD